MIPLAGGKDFVLGLGGKDLSTVAVATMAAGAKRTVRKPASK